MGRYSTFLFAEPSAIEGVARIIDFGNALSTYNLSDTPTKADERALRADAAAVNEALHENAERVTKQINATLSRRLHP